MAQYSSALARRTGTAHLKSSSGMAHGNNFFESVKNIPDRLFSKTAREPVMFGSLGAFFETEMAPPPSYEQVRIAADAQFFEEDRTSGPKRMVKIDRARGGTTFETQRSTIADDWRSRIIREPIMFGSIKSNPHCVGGAWYGNEPEAKMAGGASMHANGMFGFGNLEPETIEYLGGTGAGVTASTGLILAALALPYLRA